MRIHWAWMLAIAMAVAGCGGSDSESATGPTDDQVSTDPGADGSISTGKLITRDNAADVLRTTYANMQILGQGPGSGFSAQLPKKTLKSAAPKLSYVWNCPNGGTATINGTDGTGDISYDECWITVYPDELHMVDGYMWSSQSQSDDNLRITILDEARDLTVLSPSLSYTYSGKREFNTQITSTDPFYERTDYVIENIDLTLHDMEFNVDRQIRLDRMQTSYDVMGTTATSSDRTLVRLESRIDEFMVAVKGASAPTPLAISFSQVGGVLSGGDGRWSGDIVYTVTAADGSGAQLSADTSLRADDKLLVEMRVDEDGSGEYKWESTITLGEFFGGGN